MKVISSLLFLLFFGSLGAQGVPGKDRIALYKVNKTRTTTYTDGSQRQVKGIYYDFKLGPDGFYQSLDKNAGNLRDIVKIFPAAAKKIDEYNFYRKKNNKLTGLIVVSYLAVIAGAAMYFSERRTSPGVAYAGIGVGVLGFAGAFTINKRQDKALESAQQAIEESVNIYNSSLLR